MFVFVCSLTSHTIWHYRCLCTYCFYLSQAVLSSVLQEGGGCALLTATISAAVDPSPRADGSGGLELLREKATQKQLQEHEQEQKQEEDDDGVRYFASKEQLLKQGYMYATMLNA